MKCSNLETTLRKWIKRGRVLIAPAQLAGYDTDGLGYKSFRPDAVVIPADCEEMRSIFEHSRHLDVPLVVRGAGTSLAGGPVAAQGGVIVHTSALRAIRTICREGFWCEVECGVTLSQLDEALKPHGMFYPPDPSSGPVCTIGGNVAMNAGGAHCFRYGVTSNYVLGVEAILLDGSICRFGGPAGGRGPWQEDWKRLFVGSEGTLGAFTRFWLRILPIPEKAWTFRATYTDLRQAEKAIHALVHHASLPVAIELMDPRCVSMVENSSVAVGLPKDSFMLLAEIDGPAELVDARVAPVAEILRSAGSTDVVYTDNDEQRKKLWKARKAAGGLMGQISADLIVQDAVIPKRFLGDLLQLVYQQADALQIPVVNVFHAGDGNLHPNFLFDSRKPGELAKVEQISKRFMQRVVEVGGTLSGEHGIGNDKSSYMPWVFSPQATQMQLSVPKIFNPNHQLNPMKVFQQRSFRASPNDLATDLVEEPKEFHDPMPSQHEFVKSTTAAHSCGEPATTPTRDARCFTEFIDSVDGVMCFAASENLAHVDRLASETGLRFPLILDANSSLATQLAASGFAPASSRFGGLCDNILGMNWRLPNGHVVRVGERVAKTTTGYDLLRFLLHAPGRYGTPVDYVVRLRPDCGCRGTFYFDSRAWEVLQTAVYDLLGQCWMHWLDSIDLVAAGATRTLRLTVNCTEAEWPIFERFSKTFAAKHQLAVRSVLNESIADGCPDWVIKTTPNRVVELADTIARGGQFHVIALCYCGVLHGYFADSTDHRREHEVMSVWSHYAHDVLPEGGDIQSRHIQLSMQSDLEKVWINRFIEAANWQ